MSIDGTGSFFFLKVSGFVHNISSVWVKSESWPLSALEIATFLLMPRVISFAMPIQYYLPALFIRALLSTNSFASSQLLC